MKNIISSAIAVSLTAATLALTTASMQAEIHSKSKELVVMEARDLPEQAQTRGNSLLLHSDNSGNTYLYVEQEQEQGTRLSVFDVTDPARIKLTVSTALPEEGAFDFIRPLGENTELVYFRSGQKAGILDLYKAKRPVLRTLSTAANLDTAEALGQSGLLATTEPYKYVPAVSRDFQVIDTSSGSSAPLATFKEVRHRLTNRDTGTTFFLCNEGLTVLRQVSVENDYKLQQLQMKGN